MRKISTTVQLPKDLLDSLNEVKKETGVSKNIIIERSLRAFFDGRILELSGDLMAKLKAIEEEYGSSFNFVIQKALEMFFEMEIREASEK